MCAIGPVGPNDGGNLAGDAGHFDQTRFGYAFEAFTGLAQPRYVEVRRRSLREPSGTCWTAGHRRPIDFYKTDSA